MNSKVVIIYLATPSPTNLDIYGIHCLEFLLNLPLSNSEQSLEFYPTSSLFGTSLGLSMFLTPSRAYRILLVVPTSLPNWVLGLPPQNGLDTFYRSISGFLIHSMVSIDLLCSSLWLTSDTDLDTSCGSYQLFFPIH
jgi:hypothetical protein